MAIDIRGCPRDTAKLPVWQPQGEHRFAAWRDWANKLTRPSIQRMARISYRNRADYSIKL